MKPIKSFFYIVLILFVVFSCSKSSESDSLKILFIGNSYTYYNSSPELIRALINERFPNKTVEIKLISQGGRTLKRHWEEGIAMDAIKANDWDFVVLQEQSKLGMRFVIDNDTYFGQTDNFYKYARKFDEEIKKSGALTAFFMTWSTKQRPEEQKILTHAYSTIASELQAKLIPVGLVWDEVRNNKEFDLYVNDGSHPSAYGSYLVAASIFSTLLDKSSSGLSGEISGFKLSSSGEPSLETEPLVSISDANALVIQKASWEVIEDIRKQGGYVNIGQPKQHYSLPVLADGEIIDSNLIEGKWYGTSTYSNDYLGLILDVEHSENNYEMELSFYTPDRQDNITVKDVELLEKRINMIIIDSLRSMSSNVSFSLNREQLLGISKSFGSNVINYKHWNLSRQKSQNDIDLEALDLLMTSFKKEISEKGYTKAAINHYKRYSSLVNTTYLPDDEHLNAVGYSLLRDKKVNEALNIFELAMTLYPESVNTYDSYGETLIGSGQYGKGLMIYTKGYELAKKTGDENVAYMEANLKKFKEGNSNQLQSVLPPPPPPPTH